MKLENRLAMYARFLIGAIATVLVGAIVFTSTPASAVQYPDPIFPLPLVETAPFPWDSIQGIWTGRTDSKRLVKYSFEVLSDVSGRKILSVIELDGERDQIISSGNGVVESRNNMIKAAMAGEHGSPHLVFVGVYVNEVDVRYPRNITVLTLRNFGDQSEQYSVVIEKVAQMPFRAPSK